MSCGGVHFYGSMAEHEEQLRQDRIEKRPAATATAAAVQQQRNRARPEQPAMHNKPSVSNKPSVINPYLKTKKKKTSPDSSMDSLRTAPTEMTTATINDNGTSSSRQPHSGGAGVPGEILMTTENLLDELLEEAKVEGANKSLETYFVATVTSGRTGASQHVVNTSSTGATNRSTADLGAAAAAAAPSAATGPVGSNITSIIHDGYSIYARGSTGGSAGARSDGHPLWDIVAEEDFDGLSRKHKRKLVSGFEPFFSYLLRSSPRTYLEAADSEDKSHSLWREICIKGVYQ